MNEAPLEPPLGAISEAERTELRNKKDHPDRINRTKFYRVCSQDQTVHCSSKNEIGSFSFLFPAGEGYYFRNYWHAWAYVQRLKKLRGNK